MTNTIAQSNDNLTQPQLLSLLMNRALQNGLKQQLHEQQKSYVDALVDVTVQVIASIWPNSISSPNPSSHKPIADLNTFLHHILKHSRTTHSTLQLAIFYLFRIRPRVQERKGDVYVSCGRRMFLAALISAHKYLQDKTYKNSAWSKVSGLNVQEINHAEKVMLELLDYRLFVKKDTYDQWILMLQAHLRINHPVMANIKKTPVDTIPSPPSITLRTQPGLLKKAQQCLPSPPLDEDAYMPTSPSRKRRHSVDIQTETKRTCLS
ncbi:G1/S-specific cyclin pas1 [Choanephora cucurbitarum]|uniref:G1/S-specific cyclin pas1 n=1 Tax=Choanephora cucurbitarum TaxID=101091 RepID=A0A1C7NPI2_9FUNG|nr:G1/S-specific cyclin pas1 [Choanephora cucurbitarum]